MALPASGQISLNDVNVELGLTATAQIGLGDANVRGLFGVASGQISMSDGYGKANVYEVVISSSRNNISSLSSYATSAGWDGSQALQLTINSGVYLYGDQTGGNSAHRPPYPASTSGDPALVVDVANAIINNSGYIMGRGGENTAYQSPGVGDTNYGGVAITILTTGVTIISKSGGFIAGGGGTGGNGSAQTSGAGAGGGRGGPGYPSGSGGSAGGIGLSGGNAPGGGFGGGAGGGGGGAFSGPPGWDLRAGGGSGRILPGVGGATDPAPRPGGAGGSAGNVGGDSVGGGFAGGSGGGGWGADGGTYPGGPFGGGGGNAIWPNTGRSPSYSYTLTNNGTIYGATT